MRQPYVAKLCSCSFVYHFALFCRWSSRRWCYWLNLANGHRIVNMSYCSCEQRINFAIQYHIRRFHLDICICGLGVYDHGYCNINRRGLVRWGCHFVSFSSVYPPRLGLLFCRWTSRRCVCGGLFYSVARFASSCEIMPFDAALSSHSTNS